MLSRRPCPIYLICVTQKDKNSQDFLLLTKLCFLEQKKGSNYKNPKARSPFLFHEIEDVLFYSDELKEVTNKLSAVGLLLCPQYGQEKQKKYETGRGNNQIRYCLFRFLRSSLIAPLFDS